MSKIGIITFYGNSNYGNRLQNLAVQTILEEYGFKAETLVFMNNRFKWWTYNYRMYVKGIIHRDPNIFRILNFLKFNKKYINMRYLYEKENKIPSKFVSKYAYFVTGSDQVWNVCYKTVARNTDLYFLLFSEDSQKVCISPSIGVSTIPEEYTGQLREWLSGFRYLSCREKKGAQEITRITGRECEWLIDPTLYVTREQWERILSLKPVRQSPYVFVFFLVGMSKDLSEHIEKYAESAGYTVINPSDPKSGFYSIGPAKFIELLANAQIVFTDSFHVTAFSINFHKPFYVFNRKTGQNVTSRIESVCERFCLSERYIRQHKPFVIYESCSFEAADKQLIIERKKFMDYLDRCFQK